MDIEELKKMAEAATPVAWLYELAGWKSSTGEYVGWNPHLTVYKPNVPLEAIRNLKPLYYADDLAALIDRVERAERELATMTEYVDEDKADADKWHARAEAAEAENLHLHELNKSSHAIVDKIWAIFGTPSYEVLAGRTIYDLVQDAVTSAERAEAENATTGALLRRIYRWADSKCPCDREEPNPCPLCGASVENLEACKAVDKIFPRDILRDIRAALGRQS